MRLLFAVFSLCAVASAQFPPPVTPYNAPAPQGVVTYTLSNWSEYTPCTHVCGGGYQRRQRSCLYNERQVPLHYCRGPNYQRGNPLDRLFQSFSGGFNAAIETQRIECNVQECRTSLWSEWTKCSRICGGGKQESTRTCLEEGTCKFNSLRDRPCNIMDCFKISGWGPYGDCNEICGRGRRWRTRSCVPAFESYMPQYEELMGVLNRMGNGGGGLAGLFGPFDPVTAPYMGSYRKSCQVSMRNWQYCNTNRCPPCPQNQKYHSCMPCTQPCPKQQSLVNNIFSLQFLLPSLFISLGNGNEGCEGKCVRGCACQRGYYLGADQRCYLVPIQCPRTPYQLPGENIISVSGNNFYSTVIPEYPTSQAYIAPREVPYVPAAPAPAEPICPYRILLLGDTYKKCRCDGDLQTQQCILDGETECPKICYERVQTVVNPVPPVVPVVPAVPATPDAPTSDAQVTNRCPPFDVGKMDPGTNCPTGACTGDSDCPSDQICCNTDCGRACAFALDYTGP